LGTLIPLEFYKENARFVLSLFLAFYTKKMSDLFYHFSEYRYALNGQGNKYRKILYFLDNNFVHHQFVRFVSIPATIDKSTVKCDMKNYGHLCISAPSESAESRKIPINFNQTEQKKAQIKIEVEIHH
jgi:hypothetical protein